MNTPSNDPFPLTLEYAFLFTCLIFTRALTYILDIIYLVSGKILNAALGYC